MDNHFTRVNGADDFQKLSDLSQQRPVIIFKHSTTCFVSAGAYREMEQFVGEVTLVEIQSAGALSKEIEKKTGIRHESPQVIILENGQVVWSASHWKITAAAVAEAVAKFETRQA